MIDIVGYKTAIKNILTVNIKLNPNIQKRFELIKAKLFAYTHSQAEVLAVYQNQSSTSSKYASAAANFFNGDKKKSIDMINH